MPDSECGSKEGFPEEGPFCCKLKGVSVRGKKSLGTRILTESTARLKLKEGRKQANL